MYKFDFIEPLLLGGIIVGGGAMMKLQVPHGTSTFPALLFISGGSIIIGLTIISKIREWNRERVRK